MGSIFSEKPMNVLHDYMAAESTMYEYRLTHSQMSHKLLVKKPTFIHFIWHFFSNTCCPIPHIPYVKKKTSLNHFGVLLF